MTMFMSKDCDKVKRLKSLKKEFSLTTVFANENKKRLDFLSSLVASVSETVGSQSE